MSHSSCLSSPPNTNVSLDPWGWVPQIQEDVGWGSARGTVGVYSNDEIKLQDATVHVVPRHVQQYDGWARIHCAKTESQIQMCIYVAHASMNVNAVER